MIELIGMESIFEVGCMPAIGDYRGIRLSSIMRMNDGVMLQIGDHADRQSAAAAATLEPLLRQHKLVED